MSISMNPVAVLQNLSGIDKNASRIINVALGAVAAVAVVQSWGKFGEDTFTIVVILVSGYLAVTLLANVPSAIFKASSWFVFALVVVYVSCAFLKFLFPSAVFPHMSGFCFLNPAATTCPLEEQQTTQLGATPLTPLTSDSATSLSFVVGDAGIEAALAPPSVGPAPAEPVIATADGQTNDASLGPLFPGAWISINHFSPWEADKAISVGEDLIALGWNVQGLSDGLDAVKSASGVLDVRYSHVDDAENAAQLSKALTQILGLSTPMTTYSLVGTKWESDTAGHLEIWLGRNAS